MRRLRIGRGWEMEKEEKGMVITARDCGVRREVHREARPWEIGHCDGVTAVVGRWRRR